MERTHKYEKYEDYVKYQLKKTSDKTKQAKWKGSEWELKINIFKNLFKSNQNEIEQKTNAICLGSRTGQEVVALKEIGVNNVIGIDLHEFQPYTIKGDIHDIAFDNETFDLVFTNIFDHSLYPEKMASEVNRILTKDGIFIIHLQDRPGDKYTEINITDMEKIVELFSPLKLLKKTDIRNISGIIAMDVELTFVKES